MRTTSPEGAVYSNHLNHFDMELIRQLKGGLQTANAVPRPPMAVWDIDAPVVNGLRPLSLVVALKLSI